MPWDKDWNNQDKLRAKVRNDSIEKKIKERAKQVARDRMERTADKFQAGASFAAVPEGILGGVIVAIVAVITGAKPALLVAAAAVGVVLTLVHCVLMARRMATVRVGCGEEERGEEGQR